MQTHKLAEERSVPKSGEAIVCLKRGRAGPTVGKHPWIFTHAIEKTEGTLVDGGIVRVEGEKGFLGWGIYNSKSDIRVRLYSFREEQRLTRDYFSDLVHEAVALRRDLLKLMTPGGACRLIFSESDGLSGLTVDKYSDYLVVQITSRSLIDRLPHFLEMLKEIVEPKGIYFRAEEGVLRAEGVKAQSAVVMGEVPSTIEIVENSVKYWVDVREGQKTGFFSDQRMNRAEIRKYAEGRRCLDLHTYTGAFAMNLAQAGAREVVAVDASRPAIDRARQNLDLNGIKNVKLECADAFEFLSTLKPEDRFDLIVLDPPKYAPSKGAKQKALTAYFKLNLEALNHLAPGGVFMTHSCSHQIGRDDFLGMFSSAVRRSGRRARILYEGGQGLDHPISTACPETQYLKSVIAYVS